MTLAAVFDDSDLVASLFPAQVAQSYRFQLLSVDKCLSKEDFCPGLSTYFQLTSKTFGNFLNNLFVFFIDRWFFFSPLFTSDHMSTCRQTSWKMRVAGVVRNNQSHNFLLPNAKFMFITVTGSPFPVRMSDCIVFPVLHAFPLCVAYDVCDAFLWIVVV